jgi:response regulator RpfG family c-di-GMP phosphodiesterase
MAGDLGFQPLPEPNSGTDVAEHQPTVLLVEDDENTLFAMDKLLTHAGYLVLTAGSGHDAIGILEQPLSTIDVVQASHPRAGSGAGIHSDSRSLL